MDKTELEAVRANIVAEYTSQIEKLKEQMSSELNALSRLEVRFKDLSAKPKPRRTKFRINLGVKQEGKLSAKDRILAAKGVVSGKFSRKDLHAAVNHDGQGEMPVGTFSPYVSEMIGNYIIEIEKAVGNNPAVYMWKEEYEKMKVESPA